MQTPATAHEKLLLGIIEVQNVKVDCDKMGNLLGCSASAVSQHIQKLRREAKGPDGDDDEVGTPKGKGKATPATNGNDATGESPAKKRRTTKEPKTPRKPRAPAKSKAKIKEESEGEMDKVEEDSGEGSTGKKRARSEDTDTVYVKNEANGERRSMHVLTCPCPV